MQKHFIRLFWLINVTLRVYGVWFPQEGFDEGQNLQGAERRILSQGYKTYLHESGSYSRLHVWPAGTGDEVIDHIRQEDAEEEARLKALLAAERDAVNGIRTLVKISDRNHEYMLNSVPPTAQRPGVP